LRSERTNRPKIADFVDTECKTSYNSAARKQAAHRGLSFIQDRQQFAETYNSHLRVKSPQEHK